MDSEPLLGQGDVSKSQDCARAISETYAAFVRLDLIVHAAGTAVSGGFFEITKERWRDALTCTSMPLSLSPKRPFRT